MSACSVTLRCSSTSSAAAASLRCAALSPLDDSEDLSLSAFFILLAAVDISKRWREDEEVELEDVEEEVAVVRTETEVGGMGRAAVARRR